MNEHQAAIDHLRDRIARDPHNLELQDELLVHLRALKLRPQVIESLRGICSAAPDRLLERLQLGQYLEVRGEVGAAAHAFDACIEVIDRCPRFNHALIAHFLLNAQIGSDAGANATRLIRLAAAIDDFEPRDRTENQTQVISRIRLDFARRRREDFLAGITELDNRWPKDQIRRQLSAAAARWGDPDFPHVGPAKVFVIGLSRTGTSSVDAALRQCGLRSLHWVQKLTGTLPDDVDLQLFDAFSDINISADFEALAAAHPDARFIWTQRPIEHWLPSIEDHYLNYSGVSRPAQLLSPSYAGNYAGRAGQIHGSLYAHHETWAHAYQAHEERVETFFGAERPERLLRIDVTSGTGWGPLVEFLGVPQPDKPFPHINTSLRRDLRHGAEEGLDLAGKKLPDRPPATDTAVDRDYTAKAEALFESLLADRPQGVGGLISLARWAHKEGDWKTSAELWRTVRNTHPNHTQADHWRRNEIDCLLRAGRWLDAREAAEQTWSDNELLQAYQAATRNVADGTHDQLSFDHVLIITYGRSGSTLLQGILNSINGLLVRGENANAFFSFFEATRQFQVVRNHRRDPHNLLSHKAWFGAATLTPEVVMSALRDAARQILLADAADDPAVTAVGFKEIRYADLDKDLPDYLSFLDELFPNAAFIINTRDHSDTSQSAWWADQDASDVRATLERTEAHFRTFADGRSNCFEISYADITERGAKLRELFAFLGAPYSDARLDTIFAVPHSYSPNRSSFADLPTHPSEEHPRRSVAVGGFSVMLDAMVSAALDELRASPNDPGLLEKMARFMDSDEVWDTLRFEDLDNRRIINHYIKILLQISDFERVDALIDRLRERNPNGNHTALRIWLLDAQNRRPEALALALEEFRSNPDDANRVANVLEQCDEMLWRDPADNVEPLAHELLDHVLAGARNEVRLVASAIRIAVALSRDDDAFSLLESPVVTQYPHEFDVMQAWAAHRRGDVDTARQIVDQICATGSIPQVRPVRDGELTRIDTRPMVLDADNIRVLTVIRNERWRLPWFLDYYRALGVDEFYFVDNDSNDGSLEYLREQPDVRLFHTDTSYREGRSGVVWLNHLMNLFTAGWNVYVDVDEALVFPDIEVHGLRGLTDHMDRHGHDLACGQMVDMFRVETPGESFTDSVDDFITTYPLFDSTYTRTPNIRCPYYFTVGGICRLAGAGETQTKTPVLRAGRNIKLLASSHAVTPGIISDVDLGLLHFKLAGDFRRHFAEDGTVNNRIDGCQDRYRTYADFFADWTATKQTLDWSTIGRYENSHTLVQHGLIAPLPQSFT